MVLSISPGVAGDNSQSPQILVAAGQIHACFNGVGFPGVDFKSPPKVAITCDEIDRLTSYWRTLRIDLKGNHA